MKYLILLMVAFLIGCSDRLPDGVYVDKKKKYFDSNDCVFLFKTTTKSTSFDYFGGCGEYKVGDTLIYIKKSLTK